MVNEIPGVALIGAGMIASRHVTALSGLQNHARLIYVASQHPGRAEHLAAHYDGPRPRFIDDLSEVLEDSAIQSVIVATPPSVRVELVRALTSAGKHILLEKPVGRNLEEAAQLVKICEQAGCTLGVLFQHQLRATALEAKRVLSREVLGAISVVDVVVPIWREQSYYDERGRGTYNRDGGGVLITQAIHIINLMLSLIGPVAQVQAMTATSSLHRMEAEDYAVAGLRFCSGAVGSLVASTASYPHGTEAITIHCQRGSLRLTAETLETSWHDGRRDVFPDDPSAFAGAIQPTPKSVWHQAIMRDFFEAVHDGRDPVVPGRAALASHRLIEAIERSSREKAAIDVSAPSGFGPTQVVS